MPLVAETFQSQNPDEIWRLDIVNPGKERTVSPNGEGAKVILKCSSADDTSYYQTKGTEGDTQIKQLLPGETKTLHLGNVDVRLTHFDPTQKV